MNGARNPAKTIASTTRRNMGGEVIGSPGQPLADQSREVAQ
jgi:hypothetical protein